MQVGSKNAAFYLGQSVKMCTKTQEGRFVHQLSLAAAELEARYRNGQVCSHGMWQTLQQAQNQPYTC